MANPWQQWLEATPKAAYGAQMKGLKGSPFMKRYFENLYPTMYNRYLGGLGSMAQAGQQPTQTFQDFLGNYSFKKQFQGLSPWQRGERPSTFAPRNRWLMY